MISLPAFSEPYKGDPSVSDYEEAKKFLKQGKWPDAVVVLSSIVKREPGFEPAAIDLALALTYTGRREDALRLLSRTALHEKGVKRQNLIARTRVLSRQFLTNETFQVYQDGLNLVMAKKYRAGLEKFEQALKREPDNAEILVRIAQCMMMDNDYDSAAERLRLANRLNPFEPEIRLWLGRALHQRGELTDAKEELHIAHTDLHDNELAASWLAEALASIGQRTEAMQLLEKDAQARPYHIMSLITLARLRSQGSGRDSQSLWQARKTLQIALSRMPGYDPSTKSGATSEFGREFRLTGPELGETIQALLEEVESKLKENSPRSGA